MTIEELKEFLKDENNKAVFDELVKSIGYEPESNISGLKNKNTELLGKLKKLKDDITEKQKVLDGIDMEGYTNYVDSLDKGQGGNQDLIKIKRELKETKDELEKLKGIDSEYNNVLVESAISKALDENGIDQKHKSILTSAFLGKAKVEIDDNKRNVIIDDDGLGLPPKDFFEKWTETETGKAYLTKPDNAGAGTTGFSTGGSGARTIKTSELNALPNTERKAISDQIASGKIKLED